MSQYHVQRLLKYAPDALEQAYLAAVVRPRQCLDVSFVDESKVDKYGRHPTYELVVSHGVAANPLASGYWTSIRLWTPAAKEVALDGVFGWPCAHCFTGIVAVPSEYRKVHQFLLSRGWVDETARNTDPRFRPQYLASHPSVPVKDWSKQVQFQENTKFIEGLRDSAELEDLIHKAVHHRLRLAVNGG